MKVLREANVQLKFIALCLILVFLTSFLMLDLMRLKKTDAAILNLPEPTQMLSVSQSYSLAQLKGLKINPQDPYDLTFIIDHGDQKELDQDQAKELVRFFMAALTIPNKDLWVNLSPYEEQRIIEEELSQTELGEVFLKQDYVLKQLSSSLTSPDTITGKSFWNSSVNKQGKSFNKIWISPLESELYLNGSSVVINSASLKVQTEEDFLAMQKNKVKEKANNKDAILSELEREVNEGKHFAKLRQVYNALILANWFKNALKDSVYSSYINNKQVSGLNLAEDDIKEKVWQLYCKSFKDGVYNKIKKENNVKRAYFSGGLGFTHEGKIKTSASALFNDSDNLSELKIRTENVSSSIASKMENAVMDCGISSPGPLRNLFSASFNQYFKDKNLKEFRERIKNRDPEAIAKIVALASGHEFGLTKIRSQLIKSITNVNPSTVSVVNLDFTAMNTLIAYAMLKGLGLTTNYYMSKNGPLLIVGDIALTTKEKKSSKNDDAILVDLKNRQVLKMNGTLKDLYQEVNNYSVVIKGNVQSIDFLAMSKYDPINVQREQRVVYQADILYSYNFMKKSKISTLSKEIVADVGETFLLAGDSKKFDDITKKSSTYKYLRSLVFTSIVDYSSAQNSKDRQQKIKNIEQSLAEIPYDTKALGLVIPFYMSIGKYSEALKLSDRLLRIDPYNVEKLITRIKLLTLIKQQQGESFDKQKDINVSIKNILSINPNIVDFLLFQNKFAGLAILNEYFLYNNDLLGIATAVPQFDFRNRLRFIQQAALNDGNQSVANIAENIINKIDANEEIEDALIQQLNNGVIPKAFFDNLTALDKEYAKYIVSQKAQQEGLKKGLKLGEQSSQQAINHMGEQLNKIGQQLSLAQADKNAAVAQVNSLQVVNQQQAAKLKELQEYIQNVDSRVQKAAQEYANGLAIQLKEKDQELEKANKELADLTRKNNALQESGEKFQLLKSMLGVKKFDAAFEVRDDEKRPPARVMSDKLKEFCEIDKINAWLFDVFPENGVLEFKANMQSGHSRASYYEERRAANAGEKSFVSDIYNSFYRKSDAMGGFIATSNSERKTFIEKFNKQFAGVAYLYSSHDYSQLGIQLVDRTKLDPKYKNPGESAGTGGYAADVIAYGKHVQHEKIKQLGFVFTDEKTMYMWNQWRVDDSRFSPENIVQVGVESQDLIRFFNEFSQAKQWYFDKRKSSKHIQNVEERNSKLEEDKKDLKKKFNQVKEEGRIESMTRMYQRDFFDAVSESLVNEALKNNKPLSAIMFDIDKFKLFNDTYGHLMGDKVVREVAKAIKKVLAKSCPGSYAFRYGGEELVFLVPNVLDEAVYIADKIRIALANLKIKNESHGPEYLSVTASQGVASLGQPALLGHIEKNDNGKTINFEKSLLNTRVDSVESIISTADANMYAVKHNGRNGIAYNNVADGRWRFVRDQGHMTQEEFLQLPSLYDNAAEEMDDANVDVQEPEQKSLGDDNSRVVDETILNYEYINDVLESVKTVIIELKYSKTNETRSETISLLREKVTAIDGLIKKIEIWQEYSDLSASQEILINKLLPKLKDQFYKVVQALEENNENKSSKSTSVKKNIVKSAFSEKRKSGNMLPINIREKIIKLEIARYKEQVENVFNQIVSYVNYGEEFEKKISEFMTLKEEIENVQSHHKTIESDEIARMSQEFNSFITNDILVNIELYKERLLRKQEVIATAKEYIDSLKKISQAIKVCSSQDKRYNKYLSEFDVVDVQTEELLKEEIAIGDDIELNGVLADLKEIYESSVAVVVQAKEKKKARQSAVKELDFALKDIIRMNEDFSVQFKACHDEKMSEVEFDLTINSLRNHKIRLAFLRVEVLFNFAIKNNLSFNLYKDVVEVLSQIKEKYIDIDGVSGDADMPYREDIDDMYSRLEKNIKKIEGRSELNLSKILKQLMILNNKLSLNNSEVELLDSEMDIVLSGDAIEQNNYEGQVGEILSKINSIDDAKELIKNALGKGEGSIFVYNEQMLGLSEKADSTAEEKLKNEYLAEYDKIKAEKIVPQLKALSIVVSQYFTKPFNDMFTKEYSKAVNGIRLANTIKDSTEEEYQFLRQSLNEFMYVYSDFFAVLYHLNDINKTLDDDDFALILSESMKGIFSEFESVAQLMQDLDNSILDRETLEMKFSTQANVIDFIIDRFDNGSISYQGLDDWRNSAWEPCPYFMEFIQGELTLKLAAYQKKVSAITLNFKETSPGLEDPIDGDGFSIEGESKNHVDGGLLREVLGLFYDLASVPSLDGSLMAFNMAMTQMLGEQSLELIANGGNAKVDNIAFLRPNSDFFKEHKERPWFGYSSLAETYYLILEEADADLLDTVHEIENSFTVYLEEKVRVNQYDQQTIEMMKDNFFKLFVLQGGRSFGFDLGDKIIYQDWQESQLLDAFDSYAEFIDLSLKRFYKDNQQVLKEQGVDKILSIDNLFKHIMDKNNVTKPYGKFRAKDLVNTLEGVVALDYKNLSFLWAPDYTNPVFKSMIFRYAKRYAKLFALINKYDMRSSRLLANMVSGIFSTQDAMNLTKDKQYPLKLNKSVEDVKVNIESSLLQFYIENYNGDIDLDELNFEKKTELLLDGFETELNNLLDSLADADAESISKKVSTIRAVMQQMTRLAKEDIDTDENGYKELGQKIIDICNNANVTIAGYASQVAQNAWLPVQTAAQNYIDSLNNKQLSDELEKSYVDARSDMINLLPDLIVFYGDENDPAYNDLKNNYNNQIITYDDTLKTLKYNLELENESEKQQKKIDLNKEIKNSIERMQTLAGSYIDSLNRGIGDGEILVIRGNYYALQEEFFRNQLKEHRELFTEEEHNVVANQFGALLETLNGQILAAEAAYKKRQEDARNKELEIDDDPKIEESETEEDKKELTVDEINELAIKKGLAEFRQHWSVVQAQQKDYFKTFDSKQLNAYYGSIQLLFQKYSLIVPRLGYDLRNGNHAHEDAAKDVVAEFNNELADLNGFFETAIEHCEEELDVKGLGAISESQRHYSLIYELNIKFGLSQLYPTNLEKKLDFLAEKINAVINAQNKEVQLVDEVTKTAEEKVVEEALVEIEEEFAESQLSNYLEPLQDSANSYVESLKAKRMEQTLLNNYVDSLAAFKDTIGNKAVSEADFNIIKESVVGILEQSALNVVSDYQSKALTKTIREKNYNSAYEKINGVISQMQGVNDDLAQRFAEAINATKNQYDSQITAIKNGGLDLADISSSVSGQLDDLNWEVETSALAQVFTFEVVAFERTDSKTVLASL